MNPVQTRLAAVLASLLVAALSSWGVRGLSPELHAELSAWLQHTFELMLLICYALLRHRLPARGHPTRASRSASSDPEQW